MKKFACLSLVSLTLVSRVAHSDRELPPWTDPNDIALPTWAVSVQPKRDDVAIFAEPGKLDRRRGSARVGGRFPLFGAKRAAGCAGRWLLIAPFSWVCADNADLSAEPSMPPPDAVREPKYYFVSAERAYAYADPTRAEDAAADAELDPGWALSILEEREIGGERWGRTRKNVWIRMRELAPAKATKLRGEVLKGALDVAWAVSSKVPVYSEPKRGKTARSLSRYDVVHISDERTVKGQKGEWLRISESGSAKSAKEEWVHSFDVARPRLSSPPTEVQKAHEKWIDVDLQTQTVVAYEGAAPMYAALVSTGRGKPGEPTETRKGVFRIWVKLTESTMDNLEDDDAENHYSIDDVPRVQFFDKSIGLHGAFWHDDFGHVHSHGCVNLAPIDAKWLFDWSAPHLPVGFSAVLPVSAEPGTVIRIR